MTRQRELALEQAVVDAWPALERQDLDGWLLRASGGPTHRGNSVATLAAGASLDLAARLERSAAWYRERGKPSMIQIGPCSVPTGLDAALEARGYRKEGEACMAVASPATVASRCAAFSPEASSLHVARRGGSPTSAFQGYVARSPSAEWLAIAGGASRFAASQHVFAGFLSRLDGRCRFVTARDHHAVPAGVCLCIASGGRLGIYSMLTLPAFRRRGAAKALLHSVASSALAEGLRELYLLVEVGNEAARALYAACGFEDVYSYHYRVLPLAPAAC